MADNPRYLLTVYLAAGVKPLTIPCDNYEYGGNGLIVKRDDEGTIAHFPCYAGFVCSAPIAPDATPTLPQRAYEFAGVAWDPKANVVAVDGR